MVRTVAVALISTACNVVCAQGPSFVAPPRTIADIKAILDQEKPDPIKTAQRKSEAADPKLTRGEALRAAMIAILDGKSFADSGGKTLFSYGDPLFWAPYSILGDGGNVGP